jgi:hypothetical protein
MPVMKRPREDRDGTTGGGQTPTTTAAVVEEALAVAEEAPGERCSGRGSTAADGTRRPRYAWAARGGHLDVQRWAREHDCSQDRLGWPTGVPRIR